MYAVPVGAQNYTKYHVNPVNRRKRHTNFKQKDVTPFCKKNKSCLNFRLYYNRFFLAAVKVAEFKMDVTDRAKIRTIIQFCVGLLKTASETRSIIENAAQKSYMYCSLVYKWHHQFFEGQESVKDDQRSGRPK